MPHAIKNLILATFFFSLLGPIKRECTEPVPVQHVEPEELIIFNRILTKVNEKTISVIDVVKKMDMFLQKHHPQLIHSKSARFQFYSTQWRDYLTQMIDQELMLADAERLEVKVSDAEVREEILERFGPTIIPTLDQLGLSYDEVKKMVHDEMIVQRMMWFRVNSKALSRINSQDVKKAYRQFCEKNPELEEWEYQVLSIRSSDATLGAVLATKAIEILDSYPLSIHVANSSLPTVEMTPTRMHEELNAFTSQFYPSSEGRPSIHLSSDLTADEKSISEAHKLVLKTLKPGSFSQPITQTSRDLSTVHRIFYLKKHSRKQLPPFERMTDRLKDGLLQQAANEENEHYIQKLRERLGYNDLEALNSSLADFHPFSIK